MPWKKFLIFQEIILSSSNIKIFFYILSKKLFLYFGKWKHWKNSLYFRKQNFLIFHETETLKNPKKLPIFQVLTFWAQTFEKYHSSKWAANISIYQNIFKIAFLKRLTSYLWSILHQSNSEKSLKLSLIYLITFFSCIYTLLIKTLVDNNSHLFWEFSSS